MMSTTLCDVDMGLADADLADADLADVNASLVVNPISCITEV
ncbi:MAG: hypothetical protein AAGH60_00520 [Pseudomonadota bacterium]